MKGPIAALSLLSMMLGAQPALAQDKAVAEIIKDLTPSDAFTKSAFGKGVTSEETVRLQPRTDLYINFEYNSADLTQDAVLTLRALGAALQSSSLKKYSFEIVGHTDARGSDSYNLELSQKRADRVRTELIDLFGVEPQRLVSEGRGERELKAPDQPDSGLNRRVQIKTAFTDQ